MKKFVCTICGYVYDEAEQGPWEALPEDWTCPLCHAPKSAFRQEGGAPAPAVPAGGAEQQAEELRPMSAAELHALCVNLAKGCEKQYKAREAELFRELAGWYAAQALPAAGGSFDDLLELVQRDLEGGYPAANERAAAAGRQARAGVERKGDPHAGFAFAAVPHPGGRPDAGHQCVCVRDLRLCVCGGTAARHLPGV